MVPVPHPTQVLVARIVAAVRRCLGEDAPEWLVEYKALMILEEALRAYMPKVEEMEKACAERRSTTSPTG